MRRAVCLILTVGLIMGMTGASAEDFFAEEEIIREDIPEASFFAEEDFFSVFIVPDEEMPLAFLSEEAEEAEAPSEAPDLAEDLPEDVPEKIQLMPKGNQWKKISRIRLTCEDTDAILTWTGMAWQDPEQAGYEIRETQGIVSDERIAAILAGDEGDGTLRFDEQKNEYELRVNGLGGKTVQFSVTPFCLGVRGVTAVTSRQVISDIPGTWRDVCELEGFQSGQDDLVYLSWHVTGEVLPHRFVIEGLRWPVTLRVEERTGDIVIRTDVEKKQRDPVVSVSCEKEADGYAFTCRAMVSPKAEARLTVTPKYRMPGAKKHTVGNPSQIVIGLNDSWMAAPIIEELSQTGELEAALRFTPGGDIRQGETFQIRGFAKTVVFEVADGVLRAQRSYDCITDVRTCRTAEDVSFEIVGKVARAGVRTFTVQPQLSAGSGALLGEKSEAARVRIVREEQLPEPVYMPAAAPEESADDLDGYVFFPEKAAAIKPDDEGPQEEKPAQDSRNH